MVLGAASDLEPSELRLPHEEPLLYVQSHQTTFSLSAELHNIRGIWDELVNALEEFQQHLSPEQVTQLKSIAAHTPSAGDVLKLTDEINKKNSHRKSRILADRVQGFLNSVQQYCNIVDSCTGLNQTAALAWGCIKLAILITSNFAEYFEKLSKRIAQLSTYCPRLSEYEKLFGVSGRLQRALSDFYAIIVVFCSKALLVVQEKGIKRFAKSIWKTFKADFGELEEKISAAREEVSEEIKLTSEQAAHESRQLQMIETKENQVFRLLQSAEAEKNQLFRSQQISALAETQDRRVQKCVREEERHRIRLLQKVQNYDYSRSLRNAQRSRCEGTCLWLFQRAEFKEWISHKSPDSLACYGIPGCGKTVLMGSIHDFLKKEFSADKDTTIIYYFFDYLTKTSLAVPTFLRSILHQALTVEKLLPAVQRRLESLFSSEIEQWEVDANEVASLILDFCGALKTVFLLIDGLDEVDPNDGRVIRNFLKKFQGIASVKVFITTHLAMDISTVFSKCRTLKIKAQDVEPDIIVFIENQIEERSHEELYQCSSTLLESIKQALISGAQGMFLWVDLQIREICTAVEEDGTLDTIPELLMSLPETIEEIYSRALKRLSRGGDKLEQARKAFQWIACSRRPMTISEIEEAITITIDQKSWKSPSIKLNLSRLSKICGNLVDFDESTGTISLAHHTVLDFLSRSSGIDSMADFRIAEREAQCYLAEICIAYLGFVDFRASLVRTTDTRNLENLSRPINLLTPTLSKTRWLPAAFQNFGNRHWEREAPFDLVSKMRKEISAHQSTRIDPSFQLLEYCRVYWHDHSRYLPLGNRKTVKSFKAIILERNLPFDYKPWDSLSDSEPLPHWKMFSWAVRQAHTLVLHIWWDITPANEAVDYWKRLWSRDGGMLFAYACSSGNLEQTDIFLQAYKRDRSIMRPSPDELSRGMVGAAGLGHIDIVERLIQEKADVNDAAAEYGRTALQAAAGGGHLAIVERLIQEKADVNAAGTNGYNGRTALQAGAGGGHLAVVERLLQEKVDVNAAAAKYGRTALQAAAEGGHLAVVERLLQEKADFNAAAAWNDGRTALQAAAEGGHLAVVERLLQEKADVNAAAAWNDGRTALQAAAEGGHLAVIERLRAAGAK